MSCESETELETIEIASAEVGKQENLQRIISTPADSVEMLREKDVDCGPIMKRKCSKVAPCRTQIFRARERQWANCCEANLAYARDRGTGQVARCLVLPWTLNEAGGVLTLGTLGSAEDVVIVSGGQLGVTVHSGYGVSSEIL